MQGVTKIKWVLRDIGQLVRGTVRPSNCVDSNFELSSELNQIPQFNRFGITSELNETIGDSAHHLASYMKALLIILHPSPKVAREGSFAGEKRKATKRADHILL